MNLIMQVYIVYMVVFEDPTSIKGYTCQLENDNVKWPPSHPYNMTRLLYMCGTQ